MSSIPLRWGGMHFDSGGLYFDSNISFDPNEQTIACYILPENASLFGNFLGARQIIFVTSSTTSGCIIIPPNKTPSEIGSIVLASDGWHNVFVQYQPYVLQLVVMVISGGVIKVYTAKDGAILNSTSVSTGSIREVSNQGIYLGNWIDGSRHFQGTFYAALMWDVGLNEDEVKDLSNLCVCCCQDELPQQDHLLFGCIFDRLKYGDKPYDFINDVYGEPVDPNHPPRWKLRLVKDMEG